MKTWTVDQMLGEYPCRAYTRQRIEHLWAERKRLSLRDVLNLRIPAADKVWVACCLGALTKRQRDRWLEMVVTRAVRRYALKCGIPAVEEWARKWLIGEDRTEDAALEVWHAAGLVARAAIFAASFAATSPQRTANWAAIAAGRASSSHLRTAIAAESRRQLADLREVLR